MDKMKMRKLSLNLQQSKLFSNALDRGMCVEDALLQLQLTVKRASKIVYQVIDSARANAHTFMDLMLTGLLLKGVVSAALEVAESVWLSIELRIELKGRQLVKLLTADPINGGRPAEASRFLSSLRDSQDALLVTMGGMQQLPNLRSKHLLVYLFFFSSITFSMMCSIWWFCEILKSISIGRKLTWETRFKHPWITS